VVYLVLTGAIGARKEHHMTIDEICQMTTNAQLLNALHACRHGHPWNTPGTNHFQNAWFLAAQRPSYEINCAATDWLKKQADAADVR
jgi:hypothetical protein